MQSTEPRLGVATTVTFAGTMVNAALAFLTTGLVSNVLGADGTAAFFQAVAFFAIFASALSMGADTALVRGVSRALARDEQARVWPMILVALGPVSVIATATAALVWSFAPFLAEALYPANPADGALYIRLLSPFLPMTPLLGITLGATRGMGRIYPYTAIQNLLIPIVRTGLVAGAVVTTGQLVHVMLAWALPLALGVLAAFPVMWRAVRLAAPNKGSAAPCAVRDEVKPLWGFAFPRGGAALVERGLEWADVLLVIHLAGPVAGGVYAVVRRILGLGGLIESSIRIVLGPRVSQAIAINDKSGFRVLFREATTTLVLLSWPLYLFLIVHAETVLRMFGAEFPTGAVALRIASIAMLIEVSGGMLQSTLLMGGRSHWQLMNKSIQLGLLVLGCIVLVPIWGISGAALAWMVGAVANLTMASGQVLRTMETRTSLSSLLLPGLAAGGVFGLGNLLLNALLSSGTFEMIICLVVTGSIYVAVCYRWRDRLGVTSYWERV